MEKGKKDQVSKKMITLSDSESEYFDSNSRDSSCIVVEKPSKKVKVECVVSDVDYAENPPSKDSTDEVEFVRTMPAWMVKFWEEKKNFESSNDTTER